MKQQTQTNKIEFREVELKDLIEDMHQGINTVTEKVNYCENGYPIIQSKHITGGSLDLSDARFLDKEDFDFYKDKYHPKKGDILICNIGTIGKSIVIGDKNDFLIAWNLFLIKLQKDKISPNFFKFYLDELYSKKLFDKMLSGGTVKFINKSKIGSIGVPLPFLNNKPDLKEQERIVKILEKAEKVKERGRNANDLLDEYLKSVFNEMFYDRGFEEVKLEDEKYFEIIMGQSPAGSSYNKIGKGTPFFQGKKEFGEKYPIIEQWTSEPSKIALPEDILISVRAPVGSINLANIKCCIGRGLASIRCKKEIKTDFVYSFIKVKEKEIENLGNGSTFKAITSKQLLNIKIPLPPLPLQQKFARIVEQTEKLKENIKKTNSNSEELFNSLMNKAF